MNSLPEKQCKEVLDLLARAKLLVSEMFDNVTDHEHNTLENVTCTEKISDARYSLECCKWHIYDAYNCVDDVRHADLTPYSPGQTKV